MRLRKSLARDEIAQITRAIDRPVDVLIKNIAAPSSEVLDRYAAEHKRPLALGTIPSGCELIEGEFWCDEIARHDRRRLAQAVWIALGKRLL
jgi:hypothetical protein